MSKATRTKKIAHFLFLAGRTDKTEKMRKDIENCNSKIERDYVEDYYKKYYKKESNEG